MSNKFQDDLIDKPYLRFLYLGMDAGFEFDFQFASDKYNSEFEKMKSGIESYTSPKLFSNASYNLYRERIRDSLFAGCLLAMIIVVFLGSFLIVLRLF
jgi:hypothetical protein